jgi:OOP family OmpA-OmpF porin
MISSDVTRLLKLIPLVLVSLAPWAAQAEEGDWYVAPSIAYTDDDPDRLIDDSIAGGQVQFGREMSRRLSLEGLFGYHDIDGFPGQEHLELGFNVIGDFLPDSLFSPYVIGGIGYLRADVGTPDFGGSPPADSTASNATATGGLGLKIRFGESPWSLRAEWRLRHAFDSDNSLTDQVASLGIQYNFGGGSGAPVAAAAAASQAEPDTVVAAAPVDSDGDGVPNDRDQCPGTAAGVKVDAKGCEIVKLKNVYFGFDSAVLLATAKRMLDESASILKRHPDVQVDIVGYADSRGPESYNMKLSERRAEAVRSYLERAGVDSARMTTRGYGESHEGASDMSANGLAQNRRVELRAQSR